MKNLHSISKPLAFALVLSIFLFASIEVSAQYRVNKTIYDFHDYSFESGMPYILPALSGVSSLLIPGLGQAISGEVGRGLGFFAIEVVSFATAFLGALTILAWGPPIIFFAGVAGLITNHIWSSIDAVRVAKVRNMVWLDKQRSKIEIDFRPGLNALPNYKVAPALTLTFSF